MQATPHPAAFITDRVLGIAAGSIGLISIFLPWIAVPGFGINILQVMDVTNELSRLGYNPTVDIGDVSVSALAAILVCILLLVIGSIVSFFRREGGVMILLSWILFAIGFYLFMPAIVRLVIGFGAGFFLAVVASIVSLTRYAIVPYLEKRPWARRDIYAAPLMQTENDGERAYQYPPPPPPY